ncbi:hypothetical protein RN001_010027 [Aquatica leii]|uniref:DUF243 domain-containing protein n=1 Tax=Aquatica leii TaxID=1421715 RepID=A0AAN7P9F4_9COLE|nr:hypothetical protein RN001_010027 [Aquatica leii]
MKVLVVAVTLIAAIAARPDVSHLPTGSYLPSTGHISSESGHFGSITGGGIGLIGTSGFGGAGDLHGIGGIGGIGGISGIGGIGGIGGISGGGSGLVHDQKHVYFFAAPEEYSSSRLRINVVPNSQRNTKIIFVKAPSYGSVVPEVVAPQSLSEDKTLVYVLVKKPEHGGQITIPAGVGVKQAKPEVYFIKYKTQHDAQQLIQGGLQGQQVGSHVPDIGNAANFVSTLESAASHGSGTLIGGGGSHGSIGSIGSISTSGSHGSSVFTSGSTGGSFGPAGASGPY